MKVLLSFLVLTPLFTSCASIPSICRAGYARQAGQAQAMRGETYNPGQGAVCQNEEHGTFLTYFQMGYQEGKQQFCDPASVQRKGAGHGEAGQVKSFSVSSFQICENQADLAQAYDRGYQAGVSTYCSEDKVRGAAQAYGEAGRSETFPRDNYSICGPSVVSRLEQVFKSAQSAGLRNFCGGSSISEQGYQDGKEGRNPSASTEKFSVCSPAELRQISHLYNDGYQRGFGEFCSRDKLEALAGENAANSMEVSYPASHASCFERFTHLRESYRVAFQNQRAALIRSQCTFEFGRQKGASDAGSSNVQNTSMPIYCNESGYPIYLNGYLEGWRQEKGRVCDSSRAYQEGMDAARRGYSIHPNPPALCDGQYASDYNQKFREGYHFIVSQRPPVVVVPQPVHPVPVYPIEGGGHSHHHARAARRACEAKGYSHDQCRHVNSLVCIEKGYRPKTCTFESGNLHAINACIEKGYSPSSCERVTSASCIRKGYSPSSCQQTVHFGAAYEACIEKGYRPPTCSGVTSLVCIEKGFTPSSCQFDSAFTAAIDSCLQRGYSPTSCRSVKSKSCIDRGWTPSRCS